MATLTIRNLPDDLHERLRAQAKRNRRSLNQEVIAELAQKSGESDAAAKKERARLMIAMAAELRSQLQRTLSMEEIRAAIDEGRR